MKRTIECLAILAMAGAALPCAFGQTGQRRKPRACARWRSATRRRLYADTLRSGGQGPELVVVPAGRFRMGCVSGHDCIEFEQPVHEVSIGRAFAVSRYEITFEDYARFHASGEIDDRGWGRGRRPVIDVSWTDAHDYVGWLSEQTGQRYRLLTEAEWEYAARAGSDSPQPIGTAACA